MFVYVYSIDIDVLYPWISTKIFDLIPNICELRSYFLILTVNPPN